MTPLSDTPKSPFCTGVPDTLGDGLRAAAPNVEPISPVFAGVASCSVTVAPLDANAADRGMTGEFWPVVKSELLPSALVLAAISS